MTAACTFRDNQRCEQQLVDLVLFAGEQKNASAFIRMKSDNLRITLRFNREVNEGKQR
jgi:hypothetical protein